MAYQEPNGKERDTDTKKERIFYPLLFAAYPTLALFAHNKALLSFTQLITPLAIIIISVLLFLYLMSFVLKNRKKAGVFVSLFVLLFFSYGHLYYLLKDFRPEIAGHTMDAYKIYFIICGIVLPVSIFFLIKTRKNLDNLTKILNVIAASLVLISVINIGFFKLKSGAVWSKGVEFKGAVSKGADVTSYPNIYYIILDSYARGDVLRELYGYDNNDFLNYLKGKGFYVADKSISNYCQTVFSLPSSLNLQYLDDQVAKIGADNQDLRKMIAVFKHNRVFDFLKQYGYTTISFDTELELFRTDSTDIFYKKSRLSPFQMMLIESTPIRIIMEKISRKTRNDYHRERILYIFDKIAELSRNKERIFVFAHFLVPHLPFVFGENGEETNINIMTFQVGYIGKKIKSYRYYYTKQLIFVNKKARQMIDNILANSSQPPIIIIQADHGPASLLDLESLENTNLKERMSILNAYYLPGGGDKKLYPSISPVNTFRIIFNHYFKTNYPLLEDRCYFSKSSWPYKFFDVTDKVRDKE